MPEGCPPVLPRLPDTRAVCLRGIVVLWLSLLLAVSAQAQLTLNRYVSPGTNNLLVGDGTLQSTNQWVNSGLTNITGVSVTISLTGVEFNEILIGETDAFLFYLSPSTNTSAQVYALDPGDSSTSLLDTFPVSLGPISNPTPQGTNTWILDFETAAGSVGEATLDYWRIIATGDAATNGTISVGQQGIISASSGYTVTATIDAGSGTGANAVTVTNSSALTFNGGLTGSGDLNKVGSGVLSVGGNSTGFSGAFRLNEGTANFTATNALGTGVLIQSNGSSTAIFSAGGTYNENMSLYNVSFTNSGNTLSGTITNNGSGTFLSAASTTNTISGVMTGAGGLTKDGDGALVIAGSANNTFTGATVVSDGTLVLSNSSGNAINSSSSIQVNSGGTLVLGASNQIGDGIGLILNGGTFLVGASSVTETLGTLTLSASSTIDFGNFGASGLRQLTFANSSGITWTGTLTITNWQGVANTSSEFTDIFFGTGGLSLTPGQLGQIRFANQDNVAGTLLGTGELVPVPEPKIYMAALALLGVVGWRERKRLAGLLRKR